MSIWGDWWIVERMDEWLDKWTVEYQKAMPFYNGLSQRNGLNML